MMYTGSFVSQVPDTYNLRWGLIHGIDISVDHVIYPLLD